MRRIAAFVLLSGCLELSLPSPPPPPGPGTIQGSVVFAIPGRVGTRPATGATVSLLGTALSTTADADGRFTLGGVTLKSGQLLLSADTNADGTADRQRLIDLESIGAGPGRDISLGEVLLSRNATVAGRVLLADNPRVTGHGGTSVFVPGAPFSAVTGDTGDFVFENLAEGPVQVSFFRPGYAPDNRELTVRGGEEARLATVSLPIAAQGTTPAVVQGTIRFEGQPAPMARVQLVSPRVTVRTTTDANGSFSAQASTADVFQVGVELDGASSLRLYNVLLLPGQNDLGALELVAGTSTPLFIDAGVAAFDGGVVVTDAGTEVDGGFDGGGVLADGGAVLLAVIDAPYEVAPGAQGTLASGRSIGPRPLTSRWRNTGDSGVTLSFSANDTVSSSIVFTAPDAGGVFPISLQVVEANGRESALATAVIRVGTAPTVTVAPFSPAVGVVASGQPFVLRASSSGGVIAAHRWRQVSGPDVGVPAFGNADLALRAPVVAIQTPLTFEVVVEDDLGLRSAPATTTIIVQAVMAPTVTIASTPGLIIYDGDAGAVVTLQATLVGGPPDASWDFSWFPSERSCGLADGGSTFACAGAFQLNSPNSDFTEFVAPAALAGDLHLPFTVTATQRDGGLSVQASQTVVVHDQRPPQCRTSLTPLLYRVECDEPILWAQSSPSFSAGSVTVNASIVSDGGIGRFYFQRPLSSQPWNVSVQLFDLARNGMQRNEALEPRLSELVRIASVETSDSEPRPGWVSLTSPSRRFIAARRTQPGGPGDGGVRSVWTMDPMCSSAPCEAFAQSIPGRGSPPASTSVIAVGDRAYVIGSTSMPTSVFFLANGVWDELFVGTAPGEVTSLAKDQGGLWVLGGTANMGRFRVDGGVYGSSEFIAGQALPRAELRFHNGNPFVVGTPAIVGGPIVLGTYSGGVWSFGAGAGPTDSSYGVDQLPLFDVPRLINIDSEQNFATWDLQGGTWSETPVSLAEPVKAFDVAAFGPNAAVVVWVKVGAEELRLSTFTAADGLQQLHRPAGAGSNWTPGNTLRLSAPRIAVDGDDLLLTWQEEVDAGVFRIGSLGLR